jgi:ribonuclease BN (tRNA processing enzyme)
MHVTIVPASAPGQLLQLFTSYLINGTVAVDAGSLHMIGSIEEMSRVRHVLLTHAHLDHIASLPPFLDVVYDGSGDCVVIHGPAHALECLKTDVFNNRLYPDFLKISTFRPPYLRLEELQPGVTIELAGLRITPVAVNHVVPTFGYVIEDDHSAVVFPSDTGPTEEIWKVANRCKDLQAVFLECTFPGAMAWLADIAKHLTPALYAEEMKKLARPVRAITVHTHPRHRDRVVQELLELGLPRVEVGEPGKTYSF